MRYFILMLMLVLQPCWLAQAKGQEKEESAEVQAWRSFAQQLETVGVDILNSYPQPHPLDKAEGLPYLLQQLNSSIEQQLVEQPGQIALLRLGASTINKWGLDGADAKYQAASVAGEGQYRLSGRLGSARLFAVQLTRMGVDFASFAALTGEQLQADEEGRFEIIVSHKKPADWKGVWLPLDPKANSLLIREYFSDWENEMPGRYSVQRMDPNGQLGAAPLSTQQARLMMDQTIATFASRAPQWQKRTLQARQFLLNKVSMQKSDGQGLATNIYGNSWFKVEADQALLIEMAAPKALLWSVQLGNVWWESLDYINHTSSFNDSQSKPSSDGKYRFVLSQRDPGVANWLDPVGHLEGMLLFRLQDAEGMVKPKLKLVPFDQLSEYLPKDHIRVSAQQRKDAITIRLRHAARRWAP